MNEVRNRRIRLAELPTVEQPDREKTQVISISVSFNAGGINYATYKKEPKGYNLHVQLQSISRSRGFVVREFTLFTGGLKAHLEDATRYSEKTLRKLADGALDSDLCRRVVAQVCENTGVTLDATPAAAIIERRLTETAEVSV